LRVCCIYRNSAANVAVIAFSREGLGFHIEHEFEFARRQPVPLHVRPRAAAALGEAALREAARAASPAVVSALAAEARLRRELRQQ
jgi:hypothetical protein